MTPAGTSNELDFQNEWEENTHTYIRIYMYYIYIYILFVFRARAHCMVTYKYTHAHCSKRSMDQPSKIANPARGQLYKGNEYFPVRVRA